MKKISITVVNRSKRLLRRVPLLHDLVRRSYHRMLYSEWERSGKPCPPPHLVKERTIRTLAQKFNLSTFVETGFLHGEMIDGVKGIFDQLFSIELDDKLFAAGTKKFAENPNIQLLHGDSSRVLPELVGKLSTPCLFWLDAHFSGGVTACGSNETPVREELDCILARKDFDDVILIDDARAFTGGPYPKLGEVTELIRSHKPRYEVKTEADMIWAFPAG